MAQQAIDIFNAFDCDRSGFIDKPELTSACACLGLMMNESECVNLME